MISTHVLDTSLGQPAAGISVTLEKKSGPAKDGTDLWSSVATGETNADGRIAFNAPAVTGTYRLQFSVASYYANLKTECFYSDIPVIFHIRDVSRKYHVPLLLNPFGYSTYRGS